jgi:hypothetical protein
MISPSKLNEIAIQTRSSTNKRRRSTINEKQQQIVTSPAKNTEIDNLIENWKVFEKNSLQVKKN